MKARIEFVVTSLAACALGYESSNRQQPTPSLKLVKFTDTDCTGNYQGEYFMPRETPLQRARSNEPFYRKLQRRSRRF